MIICIVARIRKVQAKYGEQDEGSRCLSGNSVAGRRSAGIIPRGQCRPGARGDMRSPSSGPDICYV